MARGELLGCSRCSRAVLVLFAVAAVGLFASILEWPQLVSGISPAAEVAGASGLAQELEESEKRRAAAEQKANEAELRAAAAEQALRLAEELRRNTTDAAQRWWDLASRESADPPAKYALAPLDSSDKRIPAKDDAATSIRSGKGEKKKTGPGTPYLMPGESLATGQQLVTSDGSIFATMQNDGHFVVYKKPHDYQWGSGTMGNRFSATMDTTHFTVKDPNGKIIWSTNKDECIKFKSDTDYRFLWLQPPDGRLSLHKGSPDNPGAEVWSNNRGVPTTSAKPRRFIFFERDGAGFNNVRLQFESLVAIAAVTERTLVLPKPSHIDHQKDWYFDFDFFDARALTKVIDISVGNEMDKDTLIVTDYLHSLNLKTLDANRDWYFPRKNSRVHHFECLQFSETGKARAAHAVLNGLIFDRHLEEMASLALQRLGFADGNFDAVHIRRGDFRSFAKGFMQADDSISEKLRSIFQKKRPVLLTSDEKLTLSLGTKIAVASDAYTVENDFTRVAVDMIMCSRAKRFVGTPMSTFTNGIFELRRRDKILKRGSDVDQELRLYAGRSQEYAQPGDVCWNKVTDFNSHSNCDKGSPRCYKSC